MHANNFKLADYFKRIQFTKELKKDISTLKSMMLHQLYTIPFENLDVQAGKVVSLVPEEIVDKIIYRNRGGYCYEVNGLFAMALDSLGIKYKFIAARPMFYPVKRPKTHMAIIVTLDNENWLFDLGFGSYGIREPMMVSKIDVEIKQGNDLFKLTKLNANEFLLQAKVDDHWANQYSFDLQEQEWIDFSPANYLNSTHPDAVFVKQPLIISHSEKGRKILSGETLKIIETGSTSKQRIQPGSLGKVLSEHFNLNQ